MSGQSAAEFFDNIVDQYDAAIERCVPRYHEMLDQMIDYIPPSVSMQRILELGCGSGNLTQKLVDRFGASSIIAVDASEKMLSLTAKRFGETENDSLRSTTADLQLVNTHFQELEFEPGSFDLITSSISIHHLDDAEKLELFRKARHWLKPQGVFTFCDQFRGATDEIYQKHMSNWKGASLAMGASDSEWREWMEHQADHDFHSSIQIHFDLLDQAGFATVDCTRRYYLWTTMIAHQ